MKQDRSLLFASRITGSVVAAILGLIMVPHIIEGIIREAPYLPENNAWEGVVMTVMTGLFFLGYLISWKNARIGGMVIIAAGLLVTLPLIIVQGEAGSLMFGFPIIASGILYILDWRDSRKTS
jgi:hypothetical protein